MTDFKLDINEYKKNMAAFFKVDAANIVASMAFTNENKQSLPNYWKGLNCVINATINRPWAYHPWKPYLVDSLIINSSNSAKEIKFTILQQQSDPLGGTMTFTINGNNSELIPGNCDEKVLAAKLTETNRGKAVNV